MSVDELISQTKSIMNLNFSKPRIVLNMIVKNESRIIERCLRRVLPIIDAYCISDTGSTDDTANIIRRIMAEAGKPGEVYSEAFQNFGYNRTHALCKARIWGDYALLLDADMELHVESEWSKDLLSLDGYTIEQRSSTINWSNTRFIRLQCDVKCIGPTHEYYDFPSGSNTGHLSCIWIRDIGDGGAKTDKYARDIRLLKESLSVDPNNCRTHFYLAQSYKDFGEYDNAIHHYKRRIELGGWEEEIFYSWLQLGDIWLHKKEPERAIDAWWRGYNALPKRAETLYKICKYWRENSLHSAAYAIYQIGSKISYPRDCCLFIERNVYETLWYYEYSILAYYLKLPIDHRRYIQTCWGCSFKSNMLSNYKFYVQKLSEFSGIQVKDFTESLERFVAGRNQLFTSSTPSLLDCGDSYLMNVRYVSYELHNDGSYNLRNDEQKITTIQKRIALNRNFEILQSDWIDGIEYPDDRYQGVEDVRMFYNQGIIRFLGTVQHPDTKKITVGYGDYSGSSLRSTAINSPYNNDCEKNWVDSGLGNDDIVYSWNPLRIGRIENDALNIKQNISMPEVFRDVRGSSCGVIVGDELWFLVHIVSYEWPRYYYHMFVVLSKTYEFLRHSVLFKFTSMPIEYACGLLVEADRVCISYSTMDSSSSIMILPRSTIEKLF